MCSIYPSLPIAIHDVTISQCIIIKLTNVQPATANTRGGGAGASSWLTLLQHYGSISEGTVQYSST